MVGIKKSNVGSQKLLLQPPFSPVYSILQAISDMGLRRHPMSNDLANSSIWCAVEFLFLYLFSKTKKKKKLDSPLQHQTQWVISLTCQVFLPPPPWIAASPQASRRQHRQLYNHRRIRRHSIDASILVFANAVTFYFKQRVWVKWIS